MKINRVVCVSVHKSSFETHNRYNIFYFFTILCNSFHISVIVSFLLHKHITSSRRKLNVDFIRKHHLIIIRKTGNYSIVPSLTSIILRDIFPPSLTNRLPHKLHCIPHVPHRHLPRTIITSIMFKRQQARSVLRPISVKIINSPSHNEPFHLSN